MYSNTILKGMAVLKGEKHRYASGCLLASFHGKYEQQRPELNEVKAYSLFVPLSRPINDVQASMYRLANDIAFPGFVTKRRLHPQIFRTKSTKDSAWISPYREQILKRYKAINEAIARWVTNLTKSMFIT